MQESDYFDDLAHLGSVDWELLQRRDFKKDPEDPGKLGRYHAEALVHRRLPIEALLGIACYDSVTKATLEAQVRDRGLSTPIKVIPEWYF